MVVKTTILVRISDYFDATTTRTDWGALKDPSDRNRMRDVMYKQFPQYAPQSEWLMQNFLEKKFKDEETSR